MTNAPELGDRAPVAVGFDGSERSVAALEYAVAEASRRRVPLRVIHVSPHYGEVLPERASIDREIEAQRETADEAVTRHVARVAADVEVDLRHRVGSPSRVILAESEGSRLVVLGHEHKGLIERAVTGATTAAVAARSRVPTIVVPADWTGDGGLRRPVVVGLKDRGYVEALLDVAFEHAAGCGADVRVVEAERNPDDPEDRADARAASTLLYSWRREYPDVRVQHDVVEDDAADTLVRASTDADLVVVLRRASSVVPAHLGRVARAVVQHAVCPVAVVPAVASMGSLEVERGGAMLR